MIIGPRWPPGGPFLASSRGLGCGEAAQVEEETQVGQVETALQGWMIMESRCNAGSNGSLGPS